MKAAVLNEFGPASVMQLADVPRPLPADRQILVEVCAASINPIDWKMREGMMAQRYGSDFPMILGFDCSGIVAAVGSGVSDFAVGDEVYARSDVGTGRCYAEYALINTRTAVKKPSVLTHLEAASIPLCGLTAINGLRECAAIKTGDRVLIVGASGGVGTLAIQIAKNWGAHVTAVCSGRNLELAESLGADVVVDYTVQDPLVTDTPYDIIYDTVGVHTHDTARAALTKAGTYLTLVPVAGVEFYIPGQTEREAGKGYFVAWIPTAADLQILTDWATEDRLHAVIDSVYALDDVRAAHERSQTERAVGKIVLQVKD